MEEVVWAAMADSQRSGQCPSPSILRASSPQKIKATEGRNGTKRVSFSDSSEPDEPPQQELHPESAEVESFRCRRKSDPKALLRRLSLNESPRSRVPIRILVIPASPDGHLVYSPEIQPAPPLARKVHGRVRKNSELTSPDFELKNIRKQMKQKKRSLSQSKRTEDAANVSSLSRSLSWKKGMWKRIRLLATHGQMKRSSTVAAADELRDSVVCVSSSPSSPELVDHADLEQVVPTTVSDVSGDIQCDELMDTDEQEAQEDFSETRLGVDSCVDMGEDGKATDLCF